MRGDSRPLICFRSSGGTSTADVETVSYNAAGSVVSATNRAGQTTSIAYDGLERPVLIDAPSGMDVALSYDLLGRVTNRSGNGVSLTTRYDALSRVTQETSPTGAVGYGYDAGSRLTRLTWPDAEFMAYGYDTVGQLLSAQENGTGLVVAQYAYDPQGRLAEVARPNNVGTLYGHDAVGRLSSLSHDLPGTAQDVTLGYGYNPAGQITQRTVSNPLYAPAPAARVENSGFDGLNRLTVNEGSAVYHDGDQNVAGITLNGVAHSYTYDPAGRLVGASHGPGTGAGLVHDPAERLYAINTAAGTQQLQYAGHQLIGEYDAASSAMQYRYAPGLGLDDTVVSYPGSALSSRRWPLTDERGSVMAQTDETGAATVNTYDDYGVPGASNTGRFQYAGQPWLSETNAYHNRMRDYSPSIGRFLQTDPIIYASGLNIYNYTKSDPVNRKDPWGLYVQDVPVATLPDVFVFKCKADGVFSFCIDPMIWRWWVLDDIYVFGAADADLPIVTTANNVDISAVLNRGICATPAIGAAAGVDAYAGLGTSVSAAGQINPRNGQISAALDLGVGAGGGGEVKAQFGKVLSIAPAGSEPARLVDASINLNGTAMFGVAGVTGSTQLIGRSQGESSLGLATGTGAGGNVNVGPHVQLNAPPLWKDICNDG